MCVCVFAYVRACFHENYNNRVTLILLLSFCVRVCVCFALRRVCVKETTFIFVVLPSCKIAVIHAASSVLTCKGIAR